MLTCLWVLKTGYTNFGAEMAGPVLWADTFAEVYPRLWRRVGCYFSAQVFLFFGAFIVWGTGNTSSFIVSSSAAAFVSMCVLGDSE